LPASITTPARKKKSHAFALAIRTVEPLSIASRGRLTARCFSSSSAKWGRADRAAFDSTSSGWFIYRQSTADGLAISAASGMVMVTR
jgi:hypothetical protein